MTQDEIIRMAREAGFTDIEAKALEYFYQAAFAAGSAHERERCALVCITLGEYYAECDDFEAEDVAHACASSIRESEK